MKKYIVACLAAIMLVTTAKVARADSLGVNFEPSTYSPGNINSQDGWMKTGTYDSEVVTNTYGYSSFDTQSLRISNAVTSGSFGDQTFAKPLTDAVGEVDATVGTFTEGTRQTHFEMQFDIASASPSAQQPGLFLSVSPDRGDGSRMSYLGFEDVTGGINVIFYDVQGTDNPANFVSTDLGTFDRTIPHTIKLTMDMVDGPSNDVVKVYVDGIEKHTGTSWENYYRYDSEASAEQSPRITKTAIFRVGGSAAPTTAGFGYVIDNLSLSSSTPVAASVPEIILPTNGATVETSDLVKVDWTDSTGTNTPFEYKYEAYGDAGYTSLIYSSSWLTASEIPTPGTSPGDYYLRVKAKDSMGTETAWSNDAGSPYLVHVIADLPEEPELIGPPTTKAECKNDGWKTFNNPEFKNQGKCMKYVEMHGKKITGEVRYTAYGLERQAEFEMKTANGKGEFEYKDKNHNWYKVKITAIKVDGNKAYFAGKVTKASNHSWVGQWLFAKVEDINHGPDQIWGSFTDMTTAQNGVSSMLDPADGPFVITKGNIKIK